MASITIFTPTYNRAHTLVRILESLRNQTSDDFIWLIIDDGSTDNTQDLVNGWIDDNIIPIEYVYKENGGLHTGYNKAIEMMSSELCVCVDSDDWLPNDAVERMLSFWKENGGNQYCGLIGYDFTPDGKVIGSELPDVRSMHVAELMSKYHNDGDRKIVMRVDLLKKVYPQPTFSGEKNFNPIYLILKIDEFFPFLVLRQNLCYVDYQTDGMRANIYNQYFNSPNSFVELRKLYLELKHTTKMWKMRQYIHLIANCKIAKRSPFSEGFNNLIILLLYPFGQLLYYYLLLKRS